MKKYVKKKHLLQGILSVMMYMVMTFLNIITHVHQSVSCQLPALLFPVTHNGMQDILPLPKMGTLHLPISKEGFAILSIILKKDSFTWKKTHTIEAHV